MRAKKKKMDRLVIETFDQNEEEITATVRGIQVAYDKNSNRVTVVAKIFDEEGEEIGTLREGGAISPGMSPSDFREYLARGAVRIIKEDKKRKELESRLGETVDSIVQELGQPIRVVVKRVTPPEETTETGLDEAGVPPEEAVVASEPEPAVQ